MVGEFNLIEKYFVARQHPRKDVVLAAGDDCALVKAPNDLAIAISTDTLVAGTHFLSDANPAWVAHKALASNISDLVAMGATPAWVSLALTMPEVNEAWLEPFCNAFFELADYYGIQLIGGDTTKGPLSITLTVHGLVDANNALRRDGARVGDWVYVTGNLGDSRAGLEVILNPDLCNKPNAQALEKAHYLSTPRVLVGQALLDFATSSIDLSDGLISDIKHILRCSDVGVSIDAATLPTSEHLEQFLNDAILAKQYALSSGEEYELCFTVPDELKEQLNSRLTHCGVKVTCIGQIRSSGVFDIHYSGQPIEWDVSGYDHFE